MTVTFSFMWMEFFITIAAIMTAAIGGALSVFMYRLIRADGWKRALSLYTVPCRSFLWLTGPSGSRFFAPLPKDFDPS